MDKQEDVSEARRVLMRCAPFTIAEIHGIVEGCGHLAVVRTLEPDIAVVELIATRDTFGETLELARYMERTLGAAILHPRQAV